jgi:hypothetical protein
MNARNSVWILILLLLSGVLYGQKQQSNTVRFRLNTAAVDSADNEAPRIKLIKPALTRGEVYRADTNRVDIVGEVWDQSKIRFVSINKEILLVNETGMFVTSIFLRAGRNEVSLKSMDEHNNMREETVVIQYEPPVVTLADKINREATYYGLLIGIEDYEDPELEDLENPIRDAEALHESLVNHYTFDEENVKILRNPGRTDIIRELDQLRSKVTPSDNLLIFYAGHGYYDEAAEVGYWLPADATKETTADWFPNSTLVNHLKAIHSKHTLLITDACFAGSIFKSRAVSMQEVVYERIYEIPSRKAMTSGTLTEVPDESAFIKYLIRNLNDNTETYLSSEELFSNMKRAVISNSNVLPRYGDIQNVGNQGGDFIFLRKF